MKLLIGAVTKFLMGLLLVGILLFVPAGLAFTTDGSLLGCCLSPCWYWEL